MGMQMGYTEKEIAKMTFGKWQDLFKEFRKWHNIQMKRALFKEEKKRVSMLDL